MSVLDNGYGPVETLPIRTLRTRAAASGIIADGLKREQIVAKFYELEQENLELRQKCAVKGLSTDGTREELLIRLAKAQEGSISRSHRMFYRLAALLILSLAVAGLAVSLPHIAAALARVMGVTIFHAYLLALIVDGGICAFKVVETMSAKFNLQPIKKVVSLALIVALALSSVLNAAEFSLHATTTIHLVLAFLLAGFLAAFVYVNFLVGAYLLLNCEPKKDQEESSPSQLLLAAAATLEKLNKNADRFRGS
jgi:hypothetical protein